tara:strand:+ start:1436 stop:1762 length:327 start_codon:yes stop_codon:yes gene_type:complete
MTKFEKTLEKAGNSLKPKEIARVSKSAARGQQHYIDAIEKKIETLTVKLDFLEEKPSKDLHEGLSAEFDEAEYAAGINDLDVQLEQEKVLLRLAKKRFNEQYSDASKG